MSDDRPGPNLANALIAVALIAAVVTLNVTGVIDGLLLPSMVAWFVYQMLTD